MFEDKTLTCADCGQPFDFTASEQQFFADRGFSEPRRCRTCRAARKAARGDESGSRPSGSSFGGQREMFAATCSSCGGQAMVPFRPSGTKPVYCSDCFSRR